jgi:adenylate cyclase
MVRAAVRLCAAGPNVPCAPDRVCRAALADPAPVEELRVRTFDTFQLIDPRVKTARPVTIVDIDEKSLAKLGQWPWPRTRIADLVTNLTRLGAVVIAFDIVFAEPDRLNPDVAADTFAISMRKPASKLRALPSNDRFSPMRCGVARGAGRIRTADVTSEFDKTLPVTGWRCSARSRSVSCSISRAAAQRPVLEQAAAGRGLFTIKPERDGIVRRVPMIMQAQGADHAVAEFRDAAGRHRHRHDPDQIRKGRHQERRGQGLSASDRRNGQLWVHFARHDPSIYVSAVDVLEGRVAPEMIAGKLVLIGTSAVGLSTSRPRRSIRPCRASKSMPRCSRAR